MDAWPGPQSGPNPTNEVVIPMGGQTPPPAPTSEPAQPEPAPAPKPEAKADPKPPAPEIDQERLKKQIQFMVENPEAGKVMLDALLKTQERNPIAELDNLKLQLAVESAGRRHGIPESYNSLISGNTPDEIEAKAQQVAKLLQQQQAQPAGTPTDTGAPVVNPVQAPAPIPPPARPSLDPRTAKIEDLRAAALAEPMVTQWGEQVKIVKSAF